MSSLSEKIKNRILKFLGIEHLSDNPTKDTYTFINSIDEVKRQQLDENKVWYSANSDWLEAYYLGKEISGNAVEPIFNRNKPTYFWGRIQHEDNVKKVHSGIPKAIVDTISNVIGAPQFDAGEYTETLKAILDENDFTNRLCQEARPLTCVEGWGAFKINFDTSLSDKPIIQFYEGVDVDFITKQRKVIGIVYRDYYKYNNRNYVLLETRRIDDAGKSIIEYELFALDKNEVTQVPLKSIPELSSLPEDAIVIPNLKEIFGGIPVKYFYDPMNKNYGASIYAGKIDLFDDLDQCLSQASQTDRVSTPVEYYPEDLCQRNSQTGEAILPDTYNRQYVKGISYTDGDGKLNGAIITTQPLLNFDQYSNRAMTLVNQILIGVLSPATMGIDVSKKDNADAQREKEKVTIMTRNNIIASETLALKKIAKHLLMVQEYMNTGNITLRDYDISIKYNEFANPSFENLSQVLLPLLVQGGISPEMYVEKLYGDALSEEEKQREIDYIRELKESNDLEMGDFGLNGDNENEATNDLREEANSEAPTEGSKE